jgi:MFS transporter, PAT family, solute carrier family 33 (acetyl-CoA transportor), member 1
MLMVGSSWVRDWLQSATVNVWPLTVFFVGLYVLMATQDIVVDGWALTILSKENVGFASTCNTIGQALGYFVANQGLLALSDTHWCARFLGSAEALVTLPGFMVFWGGVFVVITLLVWVLQSERASSDMDSESLSETCRQIVSLFELPNMRTLAWILLTCKLSFAPTDAVLTFKLQEYGMPKADLATISPLLLLVGLTLPVLTSRLVNADPMHTFILGIKAKLLNSAFLWIVLQYTSTAYAASNSNSSVFLIVLTLGLFLNECFGTLIFISAMTFFSKISDPTIGGSYMTLLNTIANLGTKWPNTLLLWLLPKLDFYWCRTSTSIDFLVLSWNYCEGGQHVDGYTTAMVICAFAGVVWIYLHETLILRLAHHDSERWKPTLESTSTKSM